MAAPLPPNIPYAQELAVAIDAAERAAREILRFYSDRSAETYTKGDGSPVTDADIAADNAIRETISAAFPGDAFITEEGIDDKDRRANPRVWIVDPLDGTAQFVAGTGRFDVMIALVVDGEPTVAVTLQPTTGMIHAAIRGEGAWRRHGGDMEPLRFDTPDTPPRLVGSVYYLLPEQTEALAAMGEAFGVAEPTVMDVGFQPRAFDPQERWYDAFLGFPQDPARFAAREWDIAACDLIVHEAGGRLTDFWGRRHRYNKHSTHIVGGLLVSVDEALHERLLEAIAPHVSTTPPDPDPTDDPNP